jgi:hypothetical protein
MFYEDLLLVLSVTENWDIRTWVGFQWHGVYRDELSNWNGDEEMELSIRRNESSFCYSSAVHVFPYVTSRCITGDRCFGNPYFILIRPTPWNFVYYTIYWRYWFAYIKVLRLFSDPTNTSSYQTHVLLSAVIINSAMTEEFRGRYRIWTLGEQIDHWDLHQFLWSVPIIEVSHFCCDICELWSIRLLDAVSSAWVT